MQELSITSASKVEDAAGTDGVGDEASGAGDEDTDEIDENDPLWKVLNQIFKQSGVPLRHCTTPLA